MRRLLLPLALMTVLLAGCRAEVAFVVEVAEDGSGTVSVVTGIDDELADLLPENPDADPLDLLSQALQVGGFENATIVESREGDMTFQTLSSTFTDLDSITNDFAGSPNNPFTRLEFTSTEDRMSLDARVELPDLSAAVATTGITVPEAFLQGIESSDALSSEIRVRLPGDLVESDADRILEDGTLVWDVPLLSGGTLQLVAVTDLSSGSFPWWTLGVGAGLIAVVAVVFIGRSRQVKREQAAVAAAVAAGMPSGGEDEAGARDPTDTSLG